MRNEPGTGGGDNRAASNHETRELQNLLLNTDPYLSCDDCFEQVDEAIERLLGEGDPLSAELSTHLRGCPACHEEAFSLIELLAPDYGQDGEAAAERLARELPA